MPSLRLSYRRADVSGFWILGSALLSVLLGTAASASGADAPWAWAATGAAGVLLPGAFWRPWFQTGIWVWNGVMRRSGGWLRRYVSAVCYYTVFAAIGRSGSALDLLPPQPRSSRWTPRPDSRSGHEPRTDSGGVQWYRGLLACARNPGNAWMVFLLPSVFLLVLFRDEFLESAPPASTYTLY